MMKINSLLKNVYDINGNLHSSARVIRIMNNVIILIDSNFETFVTHKEQVKYRGYKRKSTFSHFDLAKSLKSKRTKKAGKFHSSVYTKR